MSYNQNPLVYGLWFHTYSSSSIGHWTKWYNNKKKCFRSWPSIPLFIQPYPLPLPPNLVAKKLKGCYEIVWGSVYSFNKINGGNHHFHPFSCGKIIATEMFFYFDFSPNGIWNDIIKNVWIRCIKTHFYKSRNIIDICAAKILWKTSE